MRSVRRPGSEKMIWLFGTIIGLVLLGLLFYGGRFLFSAGADDVEAPGAVLVHVGYGDWVRIELDERGLIVSELSPSTKFTLGQNDLKLSLGPDGVKRMADAIGGIPIQIDRTIEYIGADSLPVRIDPGFRKLDGDRVEVYLGNPDMRKSDLAKNIVAGVLKQVVRLKNEGHRLDILLEAALQGNSEEKVAGNGAKLGAFLIKAAAVPLQDIRVNLGAHTGTALTQRTPRSQRPSRTTTTTVRSTSSRTSTQKPTPVSAPTRVRTGPLKVIILNGTGLNGLAKRAARRLGTPTYRVIDTANADHFRYQTTLIQSNSRNDAINAASSLGFGTVLAPVSVRNADIVITLGRDARSRL
ncbi:MAG: LytR C-terminal domain-containing protein [Candidatus Lindowbacteria bacterium]|nr:LytR C-terminal domain-containing protein [Candidatus Lindowbacteria bacterium]